VGGGAPAGAVQIAVALADHIAVMHQDVSLSFASATLDGGAIVLHGAGCGSAWNVDPLSGEIGVQV
jgi:hypothetical protein